MAQDDTYQTLVYHEQDGGAEVVQSDGIIRGHSGGIASMESGYNFTLASQAILAKDMVRVVHSRNDAVTITPVALATVLPTKNLPYNTRFVTINTSATADKPSFWLTSCSAGAEVYLRLVGDLAGGFTHNAVSMTVFLSGCTLMGSGGSALTSMTMYTSGASEPMVHLIAQADNVWAIVGQAGDVNEH